MLKQRINFTMIHFIFVSVSFLIGGCAGIKIVEDRKEFVGVPVESSKLNETTTVHDYSYTFYIPFVKYSATPIDLNNYCNNKKWREAYVSGNLFSGFASVLTFGIVHPQKTEVTCVN